VKSSVLLDGAVLGEQQLLILGRALLTSSVVDDADIAALSKFDGNVLLVEVNRPERAVLGLALDGLTSVLLDAADLLANQALTEELLSLPGIRSIGLIFLGELGIVHLVARDKARGHNGGEVDLDFLTSAVVEDSDGSNADDINNATKELRARNTLGLRGLLLALGSSLGLRPHAERLSASLILGSLKLGHVGGLLSTPVNELGETLLQQLDREVLSVSDNGTKEVLGLIDTLKDNSDITVEDVQLGEETSLASESLLIVVAETVDGALNTREKNKNNMSRLREVELDGGARADLLNDGSDVTTLELLEKLELVKLVDNVTVGTVGSLLILVELTKLLVASGTFKLLQTGNRLVASVLVGLVVDLGPSSGNEVLTDVLTIKEDLGDTAVGGGRVSSTEDNTLSDQLAAQELTSGP
jgi:hypothetical protein